MKFWRSCIRWLIMPALTVLLCGCPYESEFPLDAGDEIDKDDEIIGTWRCQHPTEDTSWTVTIYPFNEQEYLIVSQERKDHSDLLRASATRVEGEKFLNIQEITLPDDVGSWMIANYAREGDELMVRLIDDKLFTEEIVSSEDLLEFIRKNLKSSDLYEEGEEVVFRRVTESSEDQ